MTMQKKEALIKKLYNKECSAEELQTLFDMLKKNESVNEGLLKVLWEQLQAYPKLKKKTSQRIFDSIQAKKAVPKTKEAKIVQLPYGRRHFFKIASAAAVISILAIAAIWQWPFSQNTNTLTTAFAEQKSIELPDGSKVLLNANSSLTFKESWSMDANRQVWLEGEAFFEVAKKTANWSKIPSYY